MMSNRLLLVAASAAVAGLLLSSVAASAACEPGKLAQKYPSLVGKTITIGADPQNPPYVMRDSKKFDKLIGVDADLARAVFKCAGVKTKFFLGGWSGLLPAVMSGQIDVMWDDLYYTAERAKTADYVVYMQAGTGAIMQKANEGKIKSLADLCGKTVSYGVGAVEENLAKKQTKACLAEGKPAVKYMPFQDLASGMRLVDSGRTDVLLWDLGFVDVTVAKYPKKYAKGFQILTGYKIGAAIKKGNKDLLKVIYDGLTEVQKTGQQKAIFEKYHVSPELSVPAAILTK